jgi:hypothetical protein
MSTAGVEGIETRMVGRDAELLALQTAYRDAMEAAETRLVTVVGEAGIGKSRLLYEFDNWIELRPEGVYYFKGRASLPMQQVPFGLFRDLFANRFVILESDSAAQALAKFRQGMSDDLSEAAGGDLEVDQIDLVGHWLGFDFSSSPAVKRLLGRQVGNLAQVYLVLCASAFRRGAMVVFLKTSTGRR